MHHHPSKLSANCVARAERDKTRCNLPKMGEKMQSAKEEGSEKAENVCFLAEVRLTSTMWGTPTLLHVHGIYEDAGIMEDL